MPPTAGSENEPGCIDVEWFPDHPVRFEHDKGAAEPPSEDLVRAVRRTWVDTAAHAGPRVLGTLPRNTMPADEWFGAARAGPRAAGRRSPGREVSDPQGPRLARCVMATAPNAVQRCCVIVLNGSSFLVRLGDDHLERRTLVRKNACAEGLPRSCRDDRPAFRLRVLRHGNEFRPLRKLHGHSGGSGPKPAVRPSTAREGRDLAEDGDVRRCCGGRFSGSRQRETRKRAKNLH